MGVIIPQVVTEDRAGGGQVIEGSLKFDKTKSQYLTRTFGSGGNTSVWTCSTWVKRVSLAPQNAGNDITTYDVILSTANDTGAITFYKNYTVDGNPNSLAAGCSAFEVRSAAVCRDINAWYHCLVTYDGTTCKLYINGVQITNFFPNTQNGGSSPFNSAIGHHIGKYGTLSSFASFYLSQYYFIDGQALTPSSFGYTDPLTNTWRPKRYTGTYGTNGFWLPMDGNSLIGKDMSGNNNDWTPVNFGGSNTIEKSTGALPILNTDGGGKVARVGVRTDSNASSLVLALPLVGIKSDFSNAVNSGTSNKAVTASGASSSSTQSNFYGGSFYFNGSGQYLELNDSEDWNFGSGDFTIEFWTYIQATGTSPAILSQYPSDADPAQDSFFFSVNTNTPYFYYYGTSNGSLNGGNVPTQTWAHLAITRSGNTWRLFVNGVIVSTQTISITLNNSTGKLRVGASESGSYPFNGYVQDLRIYKGVAKYTQNFIPASTDPDILPDTPSGVAYSSNVALVPSTDGGAVAFDGSGDYLSLSASADFGFSTPSGNSNDFTIEWFKHWTSLSGYQTVWSNNYISSPGLLIQTGNGDGKYRVYVSSGTEIFQETNAPAVGSWYHYALVRNGTTYTIYRNGVANGSATSSSAAGSGSDTATIGQGNGSFYENGFISNFHLVKGTALYTSNFTPPTGPISSVANTKLLCCKSNSSATVYDVSPGTITANGNAAASNFNPFTVNINTQRGQESGYCTLNPLGAAGATPTNGNLSVSSSSTVGNRISTFFLTSGKWYWEGSGSGYVGTIIGVGGESYTGSVSGTGSKSIGWWELGPVYWDGGNNSGSTSFTTTDVIGIALNMDAGNVRFYKNGLLVYTITFGDGTVPNLSSGVFPGYNVGAGTKSVDLNFGQKPFKFPPPAGFQPLALANTPRPTIVRPDQYVGIVTYTGTGATLSLTTGFKPDLVWIKDRTNGYNHVLFDSVRGTGGSKVLFSNRTTAEGGGTGEEGTVYGHVSSFDTYGFSVSPGSGTPLWVSNSGDNYVAWAWKAGGNSNTYNINDIGYSTASAAGLTAGTITPTGASVNTKSGFSIIGYTGTGTSPVSINHGLNSSPTFLIFKDRDSAVNWQVWTTSVNSNGTLIEGLNTAAAGTTPWTYISTTSSLIQFNSGNTAQTSNGKRFICYAWHDVPGFSRFGSFSGNNSTDGVYVSLGFRPKFLIVKCIQDIAGDVEHWIIRDSTRSTYNPANANLYANLGNAEDDASGFSGSLDLLSNGFKMRGTYGGINASATYIYAAWAETPSFNLYGGQANAR